MKHITVTTPAAEDYLKTIYAHTEWQSDLITPSALATRLDVAPSSVTEMVKKLAASGLIKHVPYGPLALTDAGILRATAVVRRHRLIETWLVREMGYDWDQVHDEAEILEHVISERLLDAINARLDYPACDPHGDSIPGSDGAVARAPAILLTDAAPGHVCTVLRISDRDPAILRDLAVDGVGPGTLLTVVEPLTVRLDSGHTRKLKLAAADSIWVSA